VKTPPTAFPPPRTLAPSVRARIKLGGKGFIGSAGIRAQKRAGGDIEEGRQGGILQQKSKSTRRWEGGKGPQGRQCHACGRESCVKNLALIQGRQLFAGCWDGRGVRGGCHIARPVHARHLSPLFRPTPALLPHSVTGGTISCLDGWAHGEGGTGEEGRNPDVGGSQAGGESEGAIAVELPGAGEVDLLRRKERSDVLGHEVLRERQVDFPAPLRRVHHRVQDLGID